MGAVTVDVRSACVSFLNVFCSAGLAILASTVSVASLAKKDAQKRCPWIRSVMCLSVTSGNFILMAAVEQKQLY